MGAAPCSASYRCVEVVNQERLPALVASLGYVGWMWATETSSRGIAVAASALGHPQRRKGRVAIENCGPLGWHDEWV